MQKLDEIFENWTVLILFHSTSININNKHKLYYYIIPHIIFVTIGIIFIPIAFCEIHLIVISIFTIYNMNKFINNNYNNYNNITDKYIRSVLFKCGMYAIFGCICWLLDFIACKNFSSYYLHAYGWHILTALSLYQAGILLKLCLLKAKNEE